jgi:hypothetical protein
MTNRVAGAANGAAMRVIREVPQQGVLRMRRSRPDATLFDVVAARRADLAAEPSALCGLLVDATFRLVDDLPERPLTADLDHADVLRMMLADHLAFGALDQIDLCRSDKLHQLADLMQRTALQGTGVPA